MNTFYRLLDRRLPNNYFIQIIIFTVLVLICSVLINFSLNFFGFTFLSDNLESRLEENKIFLFLGIVLFAPLFETFLFQWLPVLIYSSFVKTKELDFIVILFFSLIFGVLHFKSLGYIISASFSGFLYLLISFYYLRREKNFFLPVFIIHMINNLIAFTKYI